MEKEKKQREGKKNTEKEKKIKTERKELPCSDIKIVPKRKIGYSE